MRAYNLTIGDHQAIEIRRAGKSTARNPRHLASFLRQLRFQQGISLGDLARKLGAANPSKIASWIADFEHGRDISPDLLQRVIAALGADPEAVRNYSQQDRDRILRDFQVSADQPVPPAIYIRMMAAVWKREWLPKEITTRDEAIEWARSQAGRLGLKARLEWSRRESIAFDEKGEIRDWTDHRPEYPDFLA